jgi:hypothetical protein
LSHHPSLLFGAFAALALALPPAASRRLLGEKKNDESFVLIQPQIDQAAPRRSRRGPGTAITSLIHQQLLDRCSAAVNDRLRENSELMQQAPSRTFGERLDNAGAGR